MAKLVKTAYYRLPEDRTCVLVSQAAVKLSGSLVGVSGQSLPIGEWPMLTCMQIMEHAREEYLSG